MSALWLIRSTAALSRRASAYDDLVPVQLRMPALRMQPKKQLSVKSVNHRHQMRLTGWERPSPTAMPVSMTSEIGRLHAINPSDAHQKCGDEAEQYWRFMSRSLCTTSVHQLGENVKGKYKGGCGLKFDTAGEPRTRATLRFLGRHLSQNRVACLLSRKARSLQPISVKLHEPCVGGYGRFERRTLTPSLPAVSCHRVIVSSCHSSPLHGSRICAPR